MREAWPVQKIPSASAALKMRPEYFHGQHDAATGIAPAVGNGGFIQPLVEIGHGGMPGFVEAKYIAAFRQFHAGAKRAPGECVQVFRAVQRNRENRVGGASSRSRCCRRSCFSCWATPRVCAA
jgi:hypothetical protein